MKSRREGGDADEDIPIIGSGSERAEGTPAEGASLVPLELLGVPVCIVRAGEICAANSRFARLFGYDPEEIGKGVTLRQLGLDALSAPSVPPSPQETLLLDGRHRNGDVRYLEARLAAVQQEDGPAWMVTLLDVTATRRAEQEHRDLQERAEMVLRASNNVIWDWDTRTDRVRWNDVICTALGYSPEEVQGTYQWWLERIHPEDTRHVLSTLDSLLQQQGRVYSNEYRFRRGDGSYAVILSRGYVLRDESGVPVRLMGAMTDVTDHRQLEERFYQAQRMEAVGRLASGIAHDFNNVLMVVQGTTDLLLGEANINEAVRADLLEIRKAAERASVLTRQLLAFSRRQVLRPEVLDLNGVVAESEVMIRRIVGEDVELLTRLSGDLSAVRVDRRQLEHVLLNLAANARDAMPQGGRFLIETTDVVLTAADVESFPYRVEPGKYVRLAVEDSGVGIDSDTLIRIFEPFFTTKGRGKGTGLGLATVYGFVKQSGGYIWATSEPGRGTRFEIHLPRTEQRSAPVTPEPGRPTLPTGTGTILLVEDESAVRAITQRILSGAGYTVIEAQNGLEAWELFRQNPAAIDLLLTDVVMPEMGGRDLADRVLATRPDIDVIYMSGQTDDRILHHGIGRRTVNFIQKPFRPEALLQKIHMLLTRPA